MLTELPFGLPGRIFRSPMPWGACDPHGRVFGEFGGHQVGVVVVLAGDDECRRKAGRNLREFYRQQGLEVVYLPVADFGVPPSREAMKDAVRTVTGYARQGRNVVVHCSAGIGRTGLFLAGMAKDVLAKSASEALAFVRQYIPCAVETDEQIRFLEEY